MVGRQNNRESLLFTEGFSKRTLPYYPQKYNSNSRKTAILRAESQGMVKSSFLGGLNPREYWFHCCAGRDGIIDGRTKTAECGYLARSMAKYLEDIKIDQKQRIIDRSGKIVSFSFGENASMGLDTSRCTMVYGIPQFCDAKFLLDQL